MRYLMLAFGLLAFGCSTNSRTLDDPKALANLKSQATEVENAMATEDHPRMADLIHLSLVNHFGGRDASIKKLGEMADDLHKQGLTFQSFEFGTPTSLIEVAGEIYAIYPYWLNMTGPKGEAVRQPTYLVCISSDGGANWKFLDGAGVKGDRRKLKRFLPRFPDDLSLPEPQSPEVQR